MKRYKYKLLKADDNKKMSFEEYEWQFKNRRFSANGEYMIVKVFDEKAEDGMILSHEQARVLINSPFWNKK